MKKLRKGDNVVVICGKDKGRNGTITQVIGDRALVEGINVVKRHTKPNPQANNPGGVIDKVKSIHISNLMLVNSNSNLGERVSIRLVEEQSDSKNHKIKRERYFKSSNQAVK